MRLILMRHGKAEDRREDRPDRERALTNNGRRELNDHLPSLARYLMSTTNCIILSSPLRRTKETADILVRYMPNATISTKSFIATGNYKELLLELSKCDTLDTLVIVGHEPYLSDWVERLARKRTRFKKGDIEFLALNPKNPEDAIWLTRYNLDQTNMLEHFDMPLSVGMKEILFNNQRNILARKDDLLDDIEDDDALIKLRIALRRQKSYLSFIKPFADAKIYNEAQEAYCLLLNDLDHLRKLDVIVETIHAARNWELEPLISLINAERGSESMRLDMTFSSVESDRNYGEAYYKALTALSTVKEPAILSDLIVDQMTKNYKKLCNQAVKLEKSTDADALNDLRSNCKHHRYLYDRFAPIARSRAAQRSALLSRLQKALGNYYDNYHSPLLLEEITEGNNDPKVYKAIKLFKKLCDNKQADLLSSVEKMLDEMIKSKKA